MGTLSRFLSRAALAFSAFGLVGMTLIIGWQVFARYVLGNAPAWTEQAALYLMLWFILFAAAAGVREGFHIRISILQESLKGGAKTWLKVACHLIVLVFGAFMAWSGAGLVTETWRHDIPTLSLPRGSAYIPIVVAGALIVFFALEQVLAEFRGGEVEPLWN
jgi:TRAP-type C4-dicarboxylate transport system permease small subunit